MALQPFLQTINRRAYDNLTWLRLSVRQPALLLFLPAAAVGAQWKLAALIVICCLAMSWLVRETASASAGYHVLRWLVERIEREPRIRVYEPLDYFPGSRAEDIWPSGGPVSVSLIVVPNLAVPLAVPVNKDRTIIAFHSGPDQMLGSPYRYYPLLHEFGHVGSLHWRAMAFSPRLWLGFFSAATLVIAFANPMHWILLPLLAAFACWVSLFSYQEETLQAEVAADHFALETTFDLAQAGFFRGSPGAHAGPLYDDTPLQAVDDDLPMRLQNIRSEIFSKMRADIRTNGFGDIQYYCDMAVRHHGMHAEGLITAGLALTLVLCSIFVVQRVSWPSPLVLIIPSILIVFRLVIAERYIDLGTRLMKVMQESDPGGTRRSMLAVTEWMAKSKPRTLAMWTWMERFSQRQDEK